MKCLSNLRSSKLFTFSAAALAGLAISAQAQYTLTDGNSRADLNPNGQAGMYNWFVDGVDHLTQQWFWFGIGPDREFSIETISPAAVNQSAANSLTATYNNNLLNLRIDYILTGGSVGSRLSTILESITLVNHSGSEMPLRFYQYTDLDILGTAGGDTVQLDTDTFNRFNYALQTDGPLAFGEVGVTLGATHGEVSLFPVILNALNDAVPTTLNDFAGPIGPGNATFGFEWDVVLPDGGTLAVSKTKYLEIVPEPGALTLVSLGLLGLVLRRRK